jgi:CRISPR/Cas system CMR-associated protein Cmr5 small subunit
VTPKGSITRINNIKGVHAVKESVTIEAFGSINGHKVSWLFDGQNEETAEAKARQEMKKKGLHYQTYILA